VQDSLKLVNRSIAHQLLDLGACVGLDQAHGDFADDFVTLIAPSPSIAADWE